MVKREPGVRAATQEAVTKLEGEVYQALYWGLEPCNLCLIIEENQSWQQLKW